MAARRGWLLIAASMLFLVACSSGGGTDTTTADVPDVTDVPPADVPPADVPPVDVPPVDTPVPTKTMTFLTFNAGLALGYVDYAVQREPLIGPALATQAADVICLQEVWTQASADAILAATATAYPYTYLKVTDGGATGGDGPACTNEDVAPLKTCVEANCAGIDPSELATCALGKCGDEFGALPDACSTCIAANIGKSIEEILTTCTTASGATYAYDGRNGLLLLSRFPLSGTEFLRFDSYLNVRVVLHAVVQPTGVDPVDVFCTHLTADLDPDVKYAGTHASWGEEQGAQAATLVAWVGQKALATGRTAAVVMGDLNSGPALEPAIEGVHPENYAKFTAAGWTDPFAEVTGPSCSWCSDNPLVRDGKNHILDHALVVRAPAGSTFVAGRELDDPVSLTVEGAPVTSRLSDHYGVSVEITWP